MGLLCYIRCLSISLQPKVDTLFAVPFKGGQQLEPVRAELYTDRLIIYRHDLVYEDVLANNVRLLRITELPETLSFCT